MACCSYENAPVGPGYKKTHSLLKGFWRNSNNKITLKAFHHNHNRSCQRPKRVHSAHQAKIPTPRYAVNTSGKTMRTAIQSSAIKAHIRWIIGAILHLRGQKLNTIWHSTNMQLITSKAQNCITDGLSDGTHST
jgi:hypothetical protein